MLDKLKNNIPLIIVVIVLIVFGFFGLKEYKKSADNSYNYRQEAYEDCKVNYNPLYGCDELSNGVIRRETISALLYAFSAQDMLGHLEILAPLLIIFASLFEFHKKIRKGFLKNTLTRIDYHKFLKKEYLHIIKKYAFIYPLFILILFFFFYLISGNFDIVKSSKIYYDYGLGLENQKYWFICIPSFVLNFVFHSIFWLNIGIYNCKHNKHAIIAIIVSFIEYLMIFALFEFALEGGIFYHTHFEELFCFSSIYLFREVSLWEMNLFSCLLAALSTLVVYLSYRNKEKTLIEVGI